MGVRTKILVTGHRGFVGNAFYRRLITLGHDVTGIDIVEGNDARDFFRHNSERFDQVIHCAAVVGGRAKIEGDPMALAINFQLDSELFRWVLKTKTRSTIYFSSSAAYPAHLQMDGKEVRLAERYIHLAEIENPDPSIYGWSKITGELLANYARANGARVHIFRPFSGYGTEQSLDYPFPSFIDRAKKRLDPFEIWGDGEQVRDFIHIHDIVNGVFRAVDEDISTVNLCSGRATSFNELAEMVCKEAGYTPEFKHLPANPVGVTYRVGDPTLLNSFYTPAISLEQGIHKAFTGS